MSELNITFTDLKDEEYAKLLRIVESYFADHKDYQYKCNNTGDYIEYITFNSDHPECDYLIRDNCSCLVSIHLSTDTFISTFTKNIIIDECIDSIIRLLKFDSICSPSLMISGTFFKFKYNIDSICHKLNTFIGRSNNLYFNIWKTCIETISSNSDNYGYDEESRITRFIINIGWK